MKIAYLSTIHLPSRLANRIQTIKMCEAFANKEQVSLFIGKKHSEDEDIFRFYGIRNRFPIIEIKGKAISLLTMIAQSLRIALKLRRLKFTHIYTRELPIVFYALTLKKLHIIKKVFFEVHEISLQGWKARFLLKNIDGLIVITNKLKEFYLNKGIPEEKILVAPDGVDLKMFSSIPSRRVARSELGIPSDKNIICYTGHLYDWKGVHVFARSMNHLSDKYLAYFVGGTELDLRRFKEFVEQDKIPNVVVIGYVPPSLVPKYLAASDVVVLPNLEKRFSHYTSPLKLFEYMAAGRPIVASDLPAIREILNEENAMLVHPDDPIALAEGVMRVSENKALADSLVRKAFQDVQEYSWDKRAERILNFVVNK